MLTVTVHSVIPTALCLSEVVTCVAPPRDAGRADVRPASLLGLVYDRNRNRRCTDHRRLTVTKSGQSYSPPALRLAHAHAERGGTALR